MKFSLRRLFVVVTLFAISFAILQRHIEIMPTPGGSYNIGIGKLDFPYIESCDDGRILLHYKIVESWGYRIETMILRKAQ